MQYALPGAWREHAACRDKVDEMYLPEKIRGQHYGPRHREFIRNAKAICHRCPVRDECTAWALTVPDPAMGAVAGGMTPFERSDVRLLRQGA
jgi:WhiB family redox-sensing transcriptional regulator